MSRDQVSADLRTYSDLGKRRSRTAGLWLDDIGRDLSRRIRMLLRLLMATEAGAHRRKNLFGEGVFLARAETREQGCGEHFGRHRLVDSGVDSPAAFAGVLHKSRIAPERRIFGQRGSREIKQPGWDHAAATPDFGDIGNVEIETMLRRQAVDIGVLQDIKTLGIGLHQAIFDAVVNHLDEVAGADRAGVNVALFDPGIASLAPFGARDIADARRQRREDWIETIDHRLVAADHHAVAALDTPDAATGANVDIMDAAFLQRFAAAYVVLPKRVAAVDDNVAGLHQLR